MNKINDILSILRSIYEETTPKSILQCWNQQISAPTNIYSERETDAQNLIRVLFSFQNAYKYDFQNWISWSQFCCFLFLESNFIQNKSKLKHKSGTGIKFDNKNEEGCK